MSRRLIAMGTDGVCRPRSVPPFLDEIPIIGSVGAGGLNHPEDVRRIQDALNEVRPVDGGPSKMIIVDGDMTPSLIEAIKEFQKIACKMRTPDGRVVKGGATHQALARFFLEANPYTVQLVYLYLSDAASWILAAQRALDEAAGFLSGRFAASPAGFHLASRYFHIDQVSKLQAAMDLDRIRRIYTRMHSVVAHRSAMTTFGSGYFQADGMSDDALAYTFFGGYDRGPVMSSVDSYIGLDQREDSIFICTRMINPRAREAIINTVVHELSHFVGPDLSSPDRIDDHSYWFKPDFFKMSPFLATRCADSFAFFAAEAKLGRAPRSGRG